MSNLPTDSPETPQPETFDNLAWHEANVKETWQKVLDVLACFPQVEDRSDILGLIHILRNSERWIGREREARRSTPEAPTPTPPTQGKACGCKDGWACDVCSPAPYTAFGQTFPAPSPAIAPESPTEQALDIKDLKHAFWEMFYHNEFDEIALDFAQIDGNDHPVFQKLAENFLRRYIPGGP